jgi:hypothetical protein
MTAAMAFFFIVFFATLLGSKERAPGLVLPTAVAYHDGGGRFVLNFRPWVVAAIILLAIAYIPPLYEIVTGPTQKVPAYEPSSPVVARP